MMKIKTKTVIKKSECLAKNVPYIDKLKLFTNGAILKSDGHYFKAAISGIVRMKCETRVGWVLCSNSITDILEHNDGVIYEEVALPWYDVIPENGILCWITCDHTEIDTIESYDNISGKFKSAAGYRDYAMPLTIYERQQLDEDLISGITL